MAITKRNRGARRKGRRGGRNASSMMPADSAFSGTMLRLFNYSDNVSMSEEAAGGGSLQVYRTGDLYDPDYTGFGHQPLYFDQLCTSSGPYLNFVVPRAVFDLRILNTSSVPVQVVVLLSNYPSLSGGKEPVMERPYGYKRLLAPTGTAGALINRRITVDNHTLAGVTKQTYLANYAGNYATSAPGLSNNFGTYLIVVIYGIGGIGSVVVSVNAKFHAKMFALGPEPAS